PAHRGGARARGRQPGEGGGHAGDQPEHAAQEDHRARHSDPARRRRLPRVTRLALPVLYAIVDPLDTGRSPVALATALLAGGAPLLPLPLKGASSRELLAEARAIKPLVSRAGGRLIVNDRPDVARAAEADGVHLGQDDLPVAAARAVLPPAAIVGVSTHAVEQAHAAAAAGA